MFNFFRKKKKGKTPAPPTPRVEKDKTIPDMPDSFGYKCMWFSIKSENAQKIAEIMQLGPLEPCNWDVGIERAYEEDIFITPPVDGWTMVVGWGLLSADTPEGIRETKESLLLLSKEFGEAQYFITHRVVEYHLWMKAINGSFIWAYGFENGGTVIQEGDPVEIEASLGHSNDVSSKNFTIVQNYTNPGEQTVMEIAGKWSVDPSVLAERTDLKPGLGYLVTSVFGQA